MRKSHVFQGRIQIDSHSINQVFDNEKQDLAISILCKNIIYFYNISKF